MKHILLCGVYLQNYKVNLLFQSFSEKVRIDRRDLNLYRHIGNFWMHKCFLVFFCQCCKSYFRGQGIAPEIH